MASFAAHGGRTSTALAFLNGPKNDVVIHSNSLVSGKSTKGQADAHQPFHDLPPELAKETDPYVVSAMTMQTALKGLSRARYIREDATLTKSVAMIGDGPLERPDPSRGHDDGYESDTERGRLTRRFAVAERHLKNVLNSVRKKSSEAKKRTRSPSPPPKLGGMGSVSFKKQKLPHVTKLSDAEVAYQITTFAFLLFQTLKKS